MNWIRVKRMQFGHKSCSAVNLLETQHQKQIGILMVASLFCLMQGFMVYVGFFQNLGIQGFPQGSFSFKLANA